MRVIFKGFELEIITGFLILAVIVLGILVIDNGSDAAICKETLLTEEYASRGFSCQRGQKVQQIEGSRNVICRCPDGMKESISK